MNTVKNGTVENFTNDTLNDSKAIFRDLKDLAKNIIRKHPTVLKTGTDINFSVDNLCAAILRVPETICELKNLAEVI